MKTSLLLISALLATSAIASAQEPAAHDSVVQLPAYVVEASRLSESEKSIQAGLDEVRRTPAVDPVVVETFAPQANVVDAIASAEAVVTDRLQVLVEDGTLLARN